MTDCAQGDTGKPDTGVATMWFGYNYGAILTSYALFRLLEQQGKHPVLLDYSPLYGFKRFTEADGMARTFMRRHGIPYTAPLESDAAYNRLNDDLDTFVIGSDQVWRWSYTASCGYAYFLDYVRGEKRKVAFASSFGIDREERPEESVAKARWYLRAFDAVSTRERSGEDILRSVYGIEGACVLDPVFLCGGEAYDELTETEEPPTQPYLLSYVLDPGGKIQQLIEAAAKERGLRVINMVDALKAGEDMSGSFTCGEIAASVTPERWLHYIRHCEFFVTDSFHGVCFALIYNRPFICVAPPERGRTRFDSLLGLVGMQRCMLSPNYTGEEWNAAVAPIDWAQVNGILQRERKKAHAWLENALNAPRPAWRVALGTLVYEKLYAGFGEKERTPRREAEVRMYEQDFIMHKLPRILRLKRLWHRAWMYATIGRARRRHAARLQEMRALAYYLNRRNSRTFR